MISQTGIHSSLEPSNNSVPNVSHKQTISSSKIDNFVFEYTERIGEPREACILLLVEITNHTLEEMKKDTDIK